MRKLYILVIIFPILAILGIGATVQAESYFGYEEYGGEWVDVNKTWTDDSNMCWAATASNILSWGRWETAAYRTGSQIFENFKHHWANVGGEVMWAYDWWFSGTNYTGVAVPGGGNHWPGYNAYRLFYGATGNQMTHVKSYLQAGYGVTLAVQSGTVRHATTVWGYDYDPRYDSTDNRYFTHLYLTESDDGLTALQRSRIGVDSVSGYWHFLDGPLTGWRITMAEGFERRWIPEIAPEPQIIIDAKHRFNAKFKLAQPIFSFDYRWDSPIPPQPGDPMKFLCQIEMAGQWITLFETLYPFYSQEFQWQEIHLDLDPKFLGIYNLRFLVEGEGMVQLYRLAPIPLPKTAILFGSALLSLLPFIRREKIG